jgi:hypothetical protein
MTARRVGNLIRRTKLSKAESPVDGTPVYKIVEYDRSTGKIRTLFHGNNGSRTLPQYVWLPAEPKIVHDGGTRYIAGWHVFLKRRAAAHYMRLFKNRETKAVVLCFACGLYPKEHSRAPVFLARKLLVTDTVWSWSDSRSRRWLQQNE